MKENKTLYGWVVVVIIVLGVLLLLYLFKTPGPGRAVAFESCCCDCVSSREVVPVFADCSFECEHACPQGELLRADTCTASEAQIFLSYR